MALLDQIPHGETVEQHRPWPRVLVGDDGWARAIELLAAGRLHLARPVGRREATCTWRCSTRRPERSSSSATPATDANIRAWRRVIRRRCASNARSAICSAWRRSARPMRGRGSISASGMCAIRSAKRACGKARAVSLPAGGRRGPAPDPGRPGACRHHRARPFPLHRQRRARGAAGAAARLCAQGHRVADGGRDARCRRQARRAHLRRQHGGLFVCLRAGRRSGA